MNLQELADIATVVSVIIAAISLWFQGRGTDAKIKTLTDIVNLQNQYFSKGSQNITNNYYYNSKQQNSSEISKEYERSIKKRYG